MRRLTRRREFLAVQKGVRVHTSALTLQALRRAASGAPHREPRLGLTVTKKVGTAVVRNRIKRRLRALAADSADGFARDNDYVIVARRDALTAPYPALSDTLRSALKAAHAKLERTQQKRA